MKEYIDYNGGPGVQHIALNTSDIIQAVCYTTISIHYLIQITAKLQWNKANLMSDMFLS